MLFFSVQTGCRTHLYYIQINQIIFNCLFIRFPFYQSLPGVSIGGDWLPKGTTSTTLKERNNFSGLWRRIFNSSVPDSSEVCHPKKHLNRLPANQGRMFTSNSTNSFIRHHSSTQNRCLYLPKFTKMVRLLHKRVFFAKKG